MTVNAVEYTVIKLLGHGKGGYSYLAEKDGIQYVLKQIHHEPCDYYTFDNKIEAELRDYKKLLDAGIRIPKMLDADIQNERILKAYIPGPTIFDLVQREQMLPDYFHQVRHMAALAQKAGLNIDYFPTNFILCDGLLWYIDYECNPYTEQWNFENWGNDYWWKSPAFTDYVNQRK